MKKIVTLLFLSISAHTAFSQTVAWLKKGGDHNSDNQAFGTTIDHGHRVIITGSFSDTATFGTTTIGSKGGNDGYIVKYDSSGNVLWAKTISGTSVEMTGHSAVDASDNIFVAGYFSSSAVYFTPTDSLVNPFPGLWSGYLAKYDATGNFVWSRLLGATGSTSQIGAWAVAVDPQGYPIIGGLFNTGINIGGSVYANPYYNMFLAKFTPAGGVDWVDIGKSLGICKVNEISTDQNGKIYVTGKISSDVMFGSTNYPHVSGDDAFIGKFDTAGNVQYFKAFGCTEFVTTTSGNMDAGNSIQPDKLGNVYVGGSIMIHYVAAAAGLSQKAFYAKYNDTGGVVWMQTFGIATESVTGVAVDAANDPYISAFIYATDTIGGTIVPFSFGTNTIVAKVDKMTGNTIWLKNTGSTSGGTYASPFGFTNTGSIAIDQGMGAVMVSGQFKSDMTLGSYSVSSTTTSAKSDMYMARIWNHVVTTDVKEISNAVQVNVYPNPATAIVNIDADKPLNISLMAVDGREVMTLQNVNAIDVSALADGVYFMNIFTVDNQLLKTAKIIKN